MKNFFIGLFAGIALSIITAFLFSKFYNVHREYNFDQLRANYLLSNPTSKYPATEKVRLKLMQLQNAYSDADTNTAEYFVTHNFLRNNHIGIIGTRRGEWFDGKTDVISILKNDWHNWGKLSLDIENAQILVFGNSAWFGTIGEIKNNDFKAPVRLTGFLINDENSWKFCRLQYQFDY